MRLRLVVLVPELAALLAVGLTASPVSAAGKTCMGHAATQTKPGPDGNYYTTSGDDVIVGTAGADTVYFGEEGGTDYTCTGAGNDSVYGEEEGSFSIDLGGGNDYADVYVYGPLYINGGSGNDTIYAGVDWNWATILGGSGGDYIYPYSEGVDINAGSGVDVVYDYYGANSIDCGSGRDSYDTAGWPDISHCETILNAAHNQVAGITQRGRVRCGRTRPLCV